MDYYPSRIDNKSRLMGVTQSIEQMFWRDGFLILRGEFKNYYEEALMIAKDEAGCATSGIVYEPGEKTIRSLFGVHKSESILGELAWSSAAETVRFLLNELTYIHQSRVNFKTKSGTGWGWHSDFETWHVEDGMPYMNCASVMIALTENTKENGALQVIPGSHNYYLCCPGETPDGHWNESLINQIIGVPSSEDINNLISHCGREALTIELSPGDAVIFHCNLMHGSLPNKSASPRTNLFYVYNSVKNKLGNPFSGKEPRPEYVAAREGM